MDEAIFRNINACKELSRVTRSSYGPNGMNKMVINHLEKLFVTNDAATIIKELDVEHPAAKMIVMATKMMAQEVREWVWVGISEQTGLPCIKRVQRCLVRIGWLCM